MESEVYKRRVNTRDELHADILDAAVCIKRWRLTQTKYSAVFAHELQSAPRLTVLFWDTDCELQQIVISVDKFVI